MKPLGDVSGKKRACFQRLWRQKPGLQTAPEPTGEMGFSEADNKDVSGLCLWKDRPLYLPSNCSLLDSAYISTTFASSAVRQTRFKRNADLCKFGRCGVCGGETVVTGRGMRLKRAGGLLEDVLYPQCPLVFVYTLRWFVACCEVKPTISEASSAKPSVHFVGFTGSISVNLLSKGFFSSFFHLVNCSFSHILSRQMIIFIIHDPCSQDTGLYVDVGDCVDNNPTSILDASRKGFWRTWRPMPESVKSYDPWCSMLKVVRVAEFERNRIFSGFIGLGEYLIEHEMFWPKSSCTLRSR